MALKREITIFVILGTAAVAFLGVKKLGFSPVFSTKSEQDSSYSYRMVRNTDEGGRRRLSDYEREESSLHWQGPKDRSPKNMDLVKKVNGADAPPAAAAGSPQEKQAQAAARAKAAKAQAALRRKQQMKVEVIEDTAPKGEESSTSDLFGEVAYNQPLPALVSPSNPSSEESKAEEQGRTVGEWKALLLQSPSRANMDQLISARRKGEISSSNFYSILRDLLVSHAEDRQKAALFALSQSMSGDSFEFIVLNKDQAVAEVQTQLNAMLTKYKEPTYFVEIARLALQGRKAEVTVAAMQTIKESVNTWSEQRTQGNDGRGRSPADVARFEQNLRAMLPGLTRLSSRTDSEAATLASDLINQIESITQKT